MIFGNCSAQSSEEINSLKISCPVKGISVYVDSSRVSSSEYDLVFGALFRFYKLNVSSQDNGSCIFHPSCSEYGILALRKQGVVVGILNTLDRLTRCNDNGSHYYPEILKDGLFEDPVRDLNYEKK